MSGTERHRNVTTGTLLSDAGELLRREPRVVVAFLLAGIVVTGVDALRRGDPVTTVGFASLLDGHFSVKFGLVVRIISQAWTPLPAMFSLRPGWLVWTVGLELLRTAAIIGAGVYGFARLLETPLSLAAIVRYAAVFGALTLFSFNADVGVVLGVPLLILLFAVLVRLVAVPAYLVAGDSIFGAFRRSWYQTYGYGWAIFGVVIAVGFANHALSSIPAVGPVGSGLAAAFQVGAVAALVRSID